MCTYPLLHSYTFSCILWHVAPRIKVRTTGTKAAWHRAGITQRELAPLVDVTQNYIPAIEANTRQAGPELRQSLFDAVRADFWDVFEVVLCDDNSGAATLLVPSAQRHASTRQAPQ